MRAGAEKVSIEFDFIVIWYFSQFSFLFLLFSINKAISIMIHIERFAFPFHFYSHKIHLIGFSSLFISISSPVTKNIISSKSFSQDKPNLR